MKIRYFGHAAFEIEANGKIILVDPFITGNPTAKDIDAQQLQADYVVLTHAHYDHITDVESIIKRTKAKLISNHEIVTYYNTHFQFEGHAMNQGGTFEFDFGKISAVNAIHSSSFPDGTYGGNPLGFIINDGQKTLYLAGDTDLTMDMQLIPMFHQLDMAVLPIGGNFTMDFDRALIAADFVKCDKILGIHYDTFPLLEINHEDAKNKFANKGKTLILLQSGEMLDV